MKNAMCKLCKNEVSETDDVKDGTSHFHFECFVKYLSTKSRKHKGSPIDEIIQIAELKLKETIIAKEKNRSKTEFYNFISKEYDVPKLSKNFFMKIAGIQSGEGESKVPIDIKILKELMMTKKFVKIITDAHSLRRSKGQEELVGESKARFDVTVALSKYFSYYNARLLHAKSLESKEKREEIEKVASKIDMPSRTTLESGKYDNKRSPLEDVYF